MAWKSVSFTREQLYEKVWQRPVQQVAKDYGMSDVGFAKLCRRHRIPVPGRGYWAKREHGHEVTRPALPGVPLELSEPRVSHWVPDVDAGPLPTMPAEVLVAWERGRPEEPPEPFTPGQTSVRHPLVRTTAELLDGRRINERGIVPFVPGGIDVRVSPTMRPRALWLLQIVVERIEASGFEVRLEDQPSRAVMRAFGETVGFGVNETSRRAKDLSPKEVATYKRLFPWLQPDRMMRPTGVLRLRQLWSGGLEEFAWEDSPRKPLEGRVEEFVLKLIAWAWKRAEGRRAEAYRAEVRALWDRRQRARAARIELLDKGAASFENHRRMAEFANALHDFARSHELAPSTARWVRWAVAHARHHSMEARFLAVLGKPNRWGTLDVD